MDPKKTYYKHLADTIIKNLDKRQMEGYYFETSAEAIAKANSFLTKGTTVGYGGSMSLAESGMLASLQDNPDILLFDRSKAKDEEETTRIYHQALDSDYYFMSSNAVTAKGELVNIDGRGNRLAALIYGPKYVILFVGMNKVCSNVEDAIHRIHNIAAPQNCIRLNCKTPCSVTGVCADCLSPESPCSQTVITRRSGVPGRIKVFLIGEELGY